MITVTLDMSTKFIAYALWSDDTLVKYGKVYPTGKGDESIASFTESIIAEFDDYVDRVVYESAFLGPNVNIMKQLAKTTGAVLGGFYMLGVRTFIGIPPITWQTGIGVGKTSYKDKEKLRKKYPDKGVAWWRNKDRENRKQKVIDYVNKRYHKEFTMVDNDVADAIAIGSYIQIFGGSSGVQTKVV